MGGNLCLRFRIREIKLSGTDSLVYYTFCLGYDGLVIFGKVFYEYLTQKRIGGKMEMTD